LGNDDFISERLGMALDVASSEIDENRTLAYKPRQSSAMTRSTGAAHLGRNGPLWADQHHRTYLIPWQIARSAENGP
jgi:hypothetical protein